MAMTYRERRERRAERLRGWADKRYAGVAAVNARADEYRGDHAFNTQPGHIPERARLNRAQEGAWRSQQKAERMEERADNIERQLGAAIYNDDPDAVEALRARIAILETRRDHYKAVNSVVRPATYKLATIAEKVATLAALRDAGKITEKDYAELVSTMRAFPGVYEQVKRAPTYSYHLTNLSGNIARNRERLTRLEREREMGQ